MKQLFFVFSISLFLSSCASYQANLKDTKHEKYDLITGQPVWEIKKPSKTQFYLAPMAGGVAGYYLSKDRVVNFGGKDLSSSESQAVYAMGGFVAGLGINMLIKAVSPKSKSFNINDQNEWLKSYSQKTKSSFVFPDQSRNSQYSVSMMKTANHEKYLNSYNSYLDLMKTGRGEFSSIKEARNKLDKEFTIFSKDKRLDLQNNLDRAELSLAQNTIQRELNKVESMSSGFSKVSKYNSFINLNQYAYSVLSGEEKRLYFDKIAYEISKEMESIVSQKQSSLKNISSTMSSIPKVNSLLQEYSQDILTYSHYYDPSKYYGALRRLKTDIILDNANEVSTMMKNGHSVEAIKAIEDKFLTHTLPSENKISLLFEASRKLQELRVLELEEQLWRQKQEALKREQIMLSETTNTGEPTEAQMKYAVNRAYMAKRNQLESIKHLPQDDNNPITKLASIFAGLQSSVDVKITSLKKYGCSPAVNKPGYVCDYLTNFDFQGGNPLGDFVKDSYGSLFKAMNGQAITGRFLKVDGDWRLIEIIE